ncbi:3-methyladenine DNA glycosylase/8-oxoguanine DNA glycosylase [Jatrophihabitans endophyticus]|uniref:3-methyladenine DNA glycosylase/8-oxoguanine DNA glycosylase n=1 Tax=Jatrophihabitans endophyticus TaxID=1206085 RepID=A0A1M5RKD1_9ACTN|nr:DNA-3-methyladenine glycosylase [Jatrophihabitans endophyticus]SHH26705.1 3-methyladenine DNA glycosylase/8-oxoguanine DNA glycosylase [Jatrophihabitans endophyticus]
MSHNRRVLTWDAGHRLDLRATLAPLRRGTGDPAHRADGERHWRACLTPDGPGTLAMSAAGSVVTAHAWGPGADWLLERVPAMLGRDDDWSTLDVSTVPVLHETLRRRPGMRLVRTGLVLDALVPAILEQKVTGVEARRAWRLLLYRFGGVAPGPGPELRVPPSPQQLLDLPGWEWHRLGVDLKRQRAIRAAALHSRRLEECAAMTPADAAARLQLVPGIGVWTAAETTQRALGDPDAVSVGDYHLKNMIVHLLTGRARGTDDEMLALLAAWPGQRQRVMRLAERTGIGAPRFGPKFRYTDIRAI